MQVVVATRNMHKLREIAAILGGTGAELRSMQDYPSVPDVVEDGTTFEANASKKAVEVAKATGHWAMADDSGLEVDALGGAPGVHSARYAGEPVDYHANNAKLLKAMDGQKNRRARFRCVLALSSPAGEVVTVAGSCEGRIIEEARGANGFGYDPLFVPDGHELTFAEMPDVEKNRISHRARALGRARDEWTDIFLARN